MKTLIIITSLALASCTGLPVTFSAGLSGQTKDGTAYHADVAVPLGARTSAKEARDVTP